MGKKPKEIIENVAKYANLKVAELAKRVGYERPQVLYDITHGKTKKISADVANKIAEKYPEINLDWLLSGDGEMLKNHPAANNAGITDSNVVGGGINDATVISGLMKTLEKKDEQIGKILGSLEKKDEQIDRLLGIIEKLRSQ
jgi:hypothetical protein